MINPPPRAAARAVSDTYFGVQVVDPYRWLEDPQSQEAREWMKAQADYTRAVLDRLPLRRALLARLGELSDAAVRVWNIQRAGGLFFYYRRAPGENDWRIYVRQGLRGAERLLVTPEQFSSPDKRFSINGFSVSQDGRVVSFVISAGGSENGELRFVDTATGRVLDDRIDRVRFTPGDWLPDGRHVVYNRLQLLVQGAPPTDLYQKSRVYMHELGTDADHDPVLFGYEVDSVIQVTPAEIPFTYVPLGSKYAFAIINSGVSPNSRFYVAPVATLQQRPIPWRAVASLDDEVSAIELHGDDAYLLTYNNTPRYKVTRTSVLNPDVKNAVTVFPASTAVVKKIAAAKDALYVRTLDGGLGRLWRLGFDGREPHAVPLPYEGTAGVDWFTWADGENDGILYGLTSWTRPMAVFAHDPLTGQSTDTGLVPPIPVDFSAITSTTVSVRSHDGANVPMAIVHKRDLKRDGSNPAILDGYGAYGLVTTEPRFNSSALAWLERGGVIAFAGIRGGGEYGEEWHLAGKQQTKPNTWKDFIACAEYLVAQQYTSPRHLAGQGGSAGGILVGNAIVERPDLFGAAIIHVGVMNPLRAETTPNGVPNIPEFGSVTSEAGFKALLAMDAYMKVGDGVKYPAVMLTTGVNDPRVEPWMSAKMAARLQSATSNGRPVLLRIDYDAGHGIGTTKNQFNEQLADVYAFLFDQLKGTPEQ